MPIKVDKIKLANASPSPRFQKECQHSRPVRQTISKYQPDQPGHNLTAISKDDTTIDTPYRPKMPNDDDDDDEDRGLVQHRLNSSVNPPALACGEKPGHCFKVTFSSLGKPRLFRRVFRTAAKSSFKSIFFPFLHCDVIKEELESERVKPSPHREKFTRTKSRLS